MRAVVSKAESSAGWSWCWTTKLRALMAHFGAEASFNRAMVLGAAARFTSAEFASDISFEGATLSSIYFDSVTVDGDARFDKATLMERGSSEESEARLERAFLFGGPAGIVLRGGGSALFDNANFKAKASFEGVIFDSHGPHLGGVQFAYGMAEELTKFAQRRHPLGTGS